MIGFWYSGFGADPNTSKYEVYALVPKITINGKYKIEGRVLVLPIQGEGNAHLVFDNANLVVKYKPKVIQKNGKSYIQTEKFNLDFDTSRLHINLENLFNGDKALGDNMNQFLNVSSSFLVWVKWNVSKSIKLIVDFLFTFSKTGAIFWMNWNRLLHLRLKKFSRELSTEYFWRFHMAKSSWKNKKPLIVANITLFRVILSFVWICDKFSFLM